MSEKAFKAKYVPKLMFNHWELEVMDLSIRVHCPGHAGVVFSKATLGHWLSINKIMIKNSSTSINTIHKWILNHKKELGL